MDNLEYILNLLFKRIPVKAVLEERVSSRNFLQNDFIRIAFMYMKEYSEPELSNMWMYYKDTFDAERRKCGRLCAYVEQGLSVFDALFYYVRRMLVVQNNEIVCRYNELQNWRKLTIGLSEDLLICAYWAESRQPEEMMQIGFGWKPVIGNNNAQLNHILMRGISENHFHLYGSSPIFHLSWLSLMNNVLDSRLAENLKKYDFDRRSTNVHYGADYKEDSLALQYYQAALIRLFLFAELLNMRVRIGSYDAIDKIERRWEESQRESEKEKFEDTDCYSAAWRLITRKNVSEMLENNFLLEQNISDLQSMIIALRNTYQTSEIKEYELMDYALQGVKTRFENYNDVFAGERWLLYMCLRKIYTDEFDREQENWFYAYILIKENIRAELIQSSDNVGFENFQKYQNRKSELMQDTIFRNNAVRLAVRNDLLGKNILSLELRISPEDTVQKNYEMIRGLDKIIGEPRDKYFYTLHFIKGQDEKDYIDEFVQCRHYTKRKEVERKVNAIVGLREKYPLCAARILGIDAASNEIGCRPEVFASGFRYLRGHVKTVDDGMCKKQIPQLRVTYHVGEDFLDILDGLRAIDEAINFLNMDCGDRLGHALALGLNVEEWYHSKNNHILIPQQDYLDNLVWMYNRLIQFDIQGMDGLKDYIRKKYEFYFHQIYGRYMDYRMIEKILRKAEAEYGEIGIPNAFHNDRYDFDITQYYNAWKLRGDDPSFYVHGYFKWREDGTAKTFAGVNHIFPKQFDIRYVPEVFLLNYYYHFNSDVRREGKRRIEVRIRPAYIQGVKLIQKEMQRRIGRRGIGIETNPSSNFLIGTFKNYEKHPIFNLYNKGLTYDAKESSDCPQLMVSINTDDQGVFSTSLENEYALLASALEQAVDEKGNFLYNKSMIYEWIDSVRKMGNEQSFLIEKKVDDIVDATVKKETNFV